MFKLGEWQKLERKIRDDRNFKCVNLGKVGKMQIYLKILEIRFILENNKCISEETQLEQEYKIRKNKKNISHSNEHEEW